MNLLKTDRLLINRITLDDAAFILELMNDKDWIKNVGDRGMTSIEDAEAYIKTRFLKTYEESNLGFFGLITKNSKEVIGIAGLLTAKVLTMSILAMACCQILEEKGMHLRLRKQFMTMAISS